MKKGTTQQSATTIAAFEAQWTTIVDSTAAAFRMDAAETEWLRTKPVARVIGAIPFLAGCRNAARTAVTHLGTYLLSIRETKPFYNANSEDDGDILDRLKLISTFDGGNRAIIDRGMALIGLSMILDYNRDVQIDAALGKHNPLTTGAFDFEKAYADLVGRVEAVDCPEMEVLLSLEDVGTLGYWGTR
ncbi:MAG: hypothetical protein WCY01_13735 [Alkalispirochaeta sp.]|jgi:hypothetical protein